MSEASWIEIEDYKFPGGWAHAGQATERSRACCEQLEQGRILLFREIPFALSPQDREFLLAQKWAELRLHKNVSYRPSEDAIRGIAAEDETANRLHAILRNYSAQVTEFARALLQPYARHCTIDFASFRPLEEENRDLPLHKRNDLLHVDAFPTRPTRGGRILRIFTNLNPEKARVWETTGPFEALASQYAEQAGLRRRAGGEPMASRFLRACGEAIGMAGARRTPYDAFMLRFHDYLKENSDFQATAAKSRLEFPPLATWLVFTDGVAHAVMSGQYALEQTFLIPPAALVAPRHAPYRVLEGIAGRPLVA